MRTTAILTTPEDMMESVRRSMARPRSRAAGRLARLVEPVLTAAILGGTLGVLLACSGESSRTEGNDSASPAQPAVPGSSNGGALAASVPAAPVHWTVPMVVELLGNAGLGKVDVVGGPPWPDDITIPDTVILRNAVVADVAGSRILAVVLAEPITATRVMDGLRSANPRASVFTSNNLVVIGPPSATFSAIRDSLTSQEIRSGRM